VGIIHANDQDQGGRPQHGYSWLSYLGLVYQRDTETLQGRQQGGIDCGPSNRRNHGLDLGQRESSKQLKRERSNKYKDRVEDGHVFCKEAVKDTDLAPQLRQLPPLQISTTNPRGSAQSRLTGGSARDSLGTRTNRFRPTRPKSTSRASNIGSITPRSG
jgi:hypothetical protein